MPIRKRTKTRDPAKYFGLVDTIIEADPESGYSRSFLLIDCIRSEYFFANPEGGMRDPAGLSLVKIMSTPKRMADLFGPIAEDEWVSFELDDSGDLPLAWELRAIDEYRSGQRRSVRNMRSFEVGPMRAAQDISLAMDLRAASNWASNFRPTTHVHEFAREYLQPGNIEIIVLDVGQAAATLIKCDGASIGLFDAGAPIWFNNGSLPPGFKPPSIPSGFIFLSHWDFDHFDLGRRYYQYRSLNWFAPKQPVGPNTALFQNKLGSNLTFVHGNATHGRFRLCHGTSSKATDRNGTGYQLRYRGDRKAVLLTGDTDYALIRSGMKSSLGGVTIPHHAGRGTSPPLPIGPADAIASYGMPNSYRHPCPETINAHVRANWTISRTSEHATTPRGDRVLYP